MTRAQLIRISRAIYAVAEGDPEFDQLAPSIQLRYQRMARAAVHAIKKPEQKTMTSWRKWFGSKGDALVTDLAFDPEPKTADLVVELRRWGSVKVGTPFTGNDWGPPLTKLLNDAADEIEYLRDDRSS